MALSKMLFRFSRQIALPVVSGKDSDDMFDLDVLGIDDPAMIPLFTSAEGPNMFEYWIENIML